LVFVLLFVLSVSSDEECGCTASSTARENLLECVQPYVESENFFPEFYARDSRGLLLDSENDVDRKTYLKSFQRQFFKGYLKVFYRSFYKNAYLRTYYLRAGAAYMKRQADDLTAVCDCLQNTITCLDGSSCLRTPLPEICNLASGRVFGHCDACAGAVSDYGNRYQTARQIAERIDSMETALVEFINSRTDMLSDLSFDYDYSTDIVTVTVVLAPTSVDSSVAFNNVVYYLSQALDLFPGTVTYEIVSVASQKRQETATARLVIRNEEDVISDMDDEYSDYDSAASSHVVGVMALAAVVARFF